jgi:7-cyano-7-deazaguanine tRNA-ribosyltransferase
LSELQTVKQALVEGRLWELVESRSHNHPSLQRAFRKMLKYAEAIEHETPVRKTKGPFIISHDSLRRPEILRHQKRLIVNYTPPSKINTVILFPERYLEPFREDSERDPILEKIGNRAHVHLCTYGLAYGIIPEELLDVYPLSQSEHSLVPEADIIHSAVDRIVEFLERTNYKSCLIVTEDKWQEKLAKSTQRRLSKKMKVKIVESESLNSSVIARIVKPKTRKRMR